MACRHIKVNGLQCESPALKSGQFCYYHSKTHTVAPDVKFGQLQLPPPEDPAAIQLSVARINEAVISGRLDSKKAATLFIGLRIASHFIDRNQFQNPDGTVQSAEQNVDGQELAPPTFVCDDNDDCNDCPYSDPCPRCVHPGDDHEDGNVEENQQSASPAKPASTSGQHHRQNQVALMAADERGGRTVDRGPNGVAGICAGQHGRRLCAG